MEAYRLGSPLPSVNDFIRLEVIVAGTVAGIIGVSAVRMIVGAVRARFMRTIICSIAIALCVNGITGAVRGIVCINYVIMLPVRACSSAVVMTMSGQLTRGYSPQKERNNEH